LLSPNCRIDQTQGAKSTVPREIIGLGADNFLLFRARVFVLASNHGATQKQIRPPIFHQRAET